MNCPKCSHPMERNAVLTQDGRALTVNYLCTCCMKRVLRTEANPVLPYETKMPSPLVIGNPHQNNNKRQHYFKGISTAAVPIEGNGQ